MKLTVLTLVLSWLVSASTALTGVYEWMELEGTSQQALYLDGRQVGGYDADTDTFRRLDRTTGEWGPAEQPPWERRRPRPKPQPRPAEEDNFGIDPDPEHRKHDGESYRRNGKDISRDEALRSLQAEGGGGDKTIPDDATKMRLTIIGNMEELGTVLLDLNGPLKQLADRLVVKTYAPDHWAVARAGFVTTGKPTIYLQSPDGKVLHRQDAYRGPEQLAQAIRKADPTYEPSKDPDLTKPSLPLSADIAIPVGVLVAAGVFLLLRK